MFVSGVRQGCPLAPLLYLFVAQALQSWLKHSGVGIDVSGGGRVSVAQYADDTKALLSSLDEDVVKGFLGIMSNFSRASGQCLNEAKTELLPIGVTTTQPHPSVVGGLKVVNAARGVGITFTNKGEDNALRRALHKPLMGRVDSLSALQAAAMQTAITAGATTHRLTAAPATRFATEAAVRAATAASSAAAVAAAATAAAPAAVVAAATLEAALPVSVVPAHAAGPGTALLSSILDKYGTLASLMLSVFGRAQAAASYGVSTMLFQVEFCGLPRGSFTQALQKATTRLVDRGQNPRDSHQKLTGVPTDQLYGRPSEGGFGALPWCEHVNARHACWAANLVSAWASPVQPCFRVAIEVLRSCHMYLSPLGICCHLVPRDMGVIPIGPLSRMHEGMCALPPLQDVEAAPLKLGDWCHAAPLWGNPLLSLALMSTHFAPARAIKGLGSVGDLVLKSLWTQSMGALLCSMGVQQVWCQGAFEVHWMKMVVSVLPTGWLEAAIVAQHKITAGLIQRPGLGAALSVLLPRLGWKLDCMGVPSRIIFLLDLKVKDATALQLGTSREQRVKAHACFINETFDRGEHTVCTREEHTTLSSLFALCWSLIWENKQKEVFWRLAVDGVADGHRWSSLSGQACACGVVGPRRGHFFWSCDVARAVVQEVHRCCPESPPLVKANVWLMLPPLGVVHKRWVVICLSALNSMDVGRRQLLSLKLQGRERVDDPEYGRPNPGRGRRRVLVRSNFDKVELAKSLAICDFWARLTSFRVLNKLSADYFCDDERG